MMRDETMQHKLFHFHTAFGHPVNADYPYENVEEQVENAMVNMIDKNFDIESLIEYDEQVENTEAQQKAEDLLSLRKSLITEEYKEVMDAIDKSCVIWCTYALGSLLLTGGALTWLLIGYISQICLSSMQMVSQFSERMGKFLSRSDTKSRRWKD